VRVVYKMALPRPITCTNYWLDNLPLYFCGLAERPFAEQSEEDQNFLFEAHKHISSCHYCREGYRFLANRLFPKIPKEKRGVLLLIGSNRQYLNELLGME